MKAVAVVGRTNYGLYRIHLHRQGYPNWHLAPARESYWFALCFRHAQFKARRKLARFDRQQARLSQEWTME